MRSSKFLIVVSLVCLAACSEELDVNPPTFTKLISGTESKTWRVDEVIVKRDGIEDRDYMQVWSLCEKDDRYTFYANAEKKFEISNGPRLCEDEPQIYVDYTWSFVNAGAILTIPFPRIFGNFLVPFTVLEVNETDMRLQIFLDEDTEVSFEILMSAITND